MSEVRRLTKADILQGARRVHYVYIEKLDGELALRSLTDGQLAEVEAIKLQGTSISTRPKTPTQQIEKPEDADMAINIDLVQSVKAEYEADVLAVKYGLADEAWTVDEIKQIPTAGVVQEIARKVYELTGVTRGADDLLRKFRTE